MMHPVRLKVREFLLKKDLSLDALSKLFNQYPQEYYFRFRDWVLSHGNPPEFREINDFWKRNDPRDLEGFGGLLRDFWSRGDLKCPWGKLSKEYRVATSEAQKKWPDSSRSHH